MKINPIDFKREPAQLALEQMTACERVINSGRRILGEEVSLFEKEWSHYCNSAHAVGVANGLDALEISLRALGVGEGDEVITTSLTAYATTLAIQRCGAIPVFADIDPLTGCISANSAGKCVSSLTKAFVIVHLYGRIADIKAFQQLSHSLGIPLVEDCAQAHGACLEGRPVGSFGDVAAWSFYPTKNLGAIGDAGAITTSSDSIANRSRALRNYGQTDRYHHDYVGLNSRLDELQAAILRVRLPYLKGWTDRRRRIAERYRSEIANPLLDALEPEQDPHSHVHHLYVLRTSKRDEARAVLAAQGVNTLIHYPLLSTQQKAIRTHRVVDCGLPHAVDHCRTCFSLPLHPYLDDDEVDYIINTCNQLSM